LQKKHNARSFRDETRGEDGLGATAASLAAHFIELAQNNAMELVFSSYQGLLT
jgi:hypothetical protein